MDRDRGSDRGRDRHRQARTSRAKTAWTGTGDRDTARAGKICAYRENASSVLRGYTTMLECVVPKAGLTDCCSDEDTITLDMVLGGGLSECASKMHGRMFNWAEAMKQKQYLCCGCCAGAAGDGARRRGGDVVHAADAVGGQYVPGPQRADGVCSDDEFRW